MVSNPRNIFSRCFSRKVLRSTRIIITSESLPVYRSVDGISNSDDSSPITQDSLLKEKNQCVLAHIYTHSNFRRGTKGELAESMSCKNSLLGSATGQGRTRLKNNCFTQKFVRGKVDTRADILRKTRTLHAPSDTYQSSGEETTNDFPVKTVTSWRQATLQSVVIVSRPPLS